MAAVQQRRAILNHVLPPLDSSVGVPVRFRLARLTRPEHTSVLHSERHKKSLAQEVASRGITVNCIAPGFITSPMTDALNDKQREAILATVPIGRLGTGEEIGAAAVYLASSEAAYMTGQTLHVNGGMAMI